MRTAGARDFTVEVPGIGNFRFGRRDMADQIAINVRYAEMTQGVQPTPWLDTVCTWIATLQVLCVTPPEGFAIEPKDIDPLDEDCYTKLLKVYAALVAKEGSFRRKPASGVQAGGQGDGGNAGVLVSSQVQPYENRPAVP